QHDGSTEHCALPLEEAPQRPPPRAHRLRRRRRLDRDRGRAVAHACTLQKRKGTGGVEAWRSVKARLRRADMSSLRLQASCFLCFVARAITVVSSGGAG